jgi:hypothetical protein
MADTHTKPRRRWFRFSLRALVLVVTIVACWFGYYSNWASERRSAKVWIDAHKANTFWHGPAARAGLFPWQLRLFGELPVDLIWTEIRDEAPADYLQQTERIRRLFPEANFNDGFTRYYPPQEPHRLK